VSRLRKAYEARFELLLRRVGARRVDQGRRWLVQRGQSLARELNLPEEEAVKRLHDRLLCRRRFRHPLNSERLLFFCDAGLGGLARWLRAAGYDALWEAGIDDGRLVSKAAELCAVLVTTDSMLMERRLLRDAHVLGLWLPPSLDLRQQLTAVLREFDLSIRDPRCMHCGGELNRRDKESLKTRIPPRTYRWLNEYFVCNRCGKIFWHGTHWERIQNELREAERNCREPPV